MGRRGTAVCECCEGTFRKSRAHQRFCSIACRSIFHTQPVAERFWPKVQKGEDCWRWLGSTTLKGYGSFWDGQRLRPAHAVAYELMVGPIPLGLDCCHSCDNPPCVRPDHLFLGTRRENLQDMSRKGRSTRGEKDAMAKLSTGQVEAIRARYAAGGVYQREIAAEYGVSRSLISAILVRRAWQHVA